MAPSRSLNGGWQVRTGGKSQEQSGQAVRGRKEEMQGGVQGGIQGRVKERLHGRLHGRLQGGLQGGLQRGDPRISQGSKQIC